MEEQQQQQQQQQQQFWHPMRPPAVMPGYQMPFRPMAPSQMYLPQPLQFLQAPTAQYSDTGGMLGAYTPLYPQFQQQQQQQHPQELQQSTGYDAYRPSFQPAYPLCYGAIPPHLVQWPPMQPSAWVAGQDPRSEMHSESSSGRSPNQMQWKRNRDGNNPNGKRPGGGGGWQKNGNFRGPPNRVFLRCETCDSTFTGRNQLDAHMKTHMKSNVDTSSYDGIGKAENKQEVHSRNASVLRPLARESEDVRKWREARRRNFPTAANLQRKLQDMEARRERGELVDAEAVLRQESLKQILAKQAALGCEVAEIPAYYLSQKYTDKGLAAGERPSKMARVSTNDNQGLRNRGRKVCMYFQKGNCRKGKRCTYLHDREAGNRDNGNGNAKTDVKNGNGATSAKDGTAAAQRAPSLLAKLLSPEMKRDKSHLLQCFRFFVNNNFLTDDAAELKFFEWAETESQPKEPLVTLDADQEEDDDDEDEDVEIVDEEEEDGEC